MNPDELVALYSAAPDPPAVCGIDKVDWSAVQHAHGPATDVPAMLRALVSDVEEHRGFAAQYVCETLWHQGTVYGATAAVLPYMYRLLEAAETPDKTLLAYLIALFADGSSYLEVHVRTPENAAKWESVLAKREKTLTEERARERAEVAAVRAAVAERLKLLLPFLRDPDPDVRRNIALGLGCLPEHTSRSLPHLQAALRDETDEYTRQVLGEVVNRLSEPERKP